MPIKYSPQQQAQYQQLQSGAVPDSPVVPGQRISPGADRPSSKMREGESTADFLKRLKLENATPEQRAILAAQEQQEAAQYQQASANAAALKKQQEEAYAAEMARKKAALQQLSNQNNGVDLQALQGLLNK